jgi:hypothetical protein
MTSHRVKLGSGARMIAEGLFADGARGEALAVADLTHQRRAIDYTGLPRNERGPRIRIYGQRCYAEAGLDSSRLDTIFVFKLVGQPHPLPEKVVRYEAAFQDFTHAHALELDPLGPLFATTALPPPAPSERARIEVTERLRLALAGAPASLRASLYPRRESATPRLGDLRTLWKLLVIGARRRPAAPTRNDQILSGVITPPNLADEALRDIREYLELLFISQVLAEHVDNAERLAALTKEFALSEAPSDTARAQLWSATAHGLSALQLREELRSIAKPLEPLTEPARQRPWWDAVCRLIYALPPSAEAQAPDRGPTEDLLELVAAADDAEETELQFLAQWALRESFSANASVPPAPAETSVPPPPEPVAPQPPLLGSRERALVQTWVLRQRGFTQKDEEDLRTELERLGCEATAVAVELGCVAGWIRAPAFADQARHLLDRFRLFFSEETAVWQRALEQSEGAFAVAVAAAGVPASSDLIARRAVQASELQAAAELFQARPLWSQLPGWWWPTLQQETLGDGTIGRTPMSDAEFLELFCVARARNMTHAACERLRAIEPDLLPGVAMFPAPPDGTTADDHVAAEIAKLGRVLGLLRQKYATSLTRLLDAAKLSPVQFSEYADLLDALERRISSAAFAELVAECARSVSGDQLRGTLRAVERVLLSTAVLIVGAGATEAERDEWTQTLGWKHIERRLLELRRTDSGAGVSPVEELKLLYADVGTREDPKDRPPLLFHPNEGDPSSPFGFVRAPIVLRATRPRAMDLVLQLGDDTDPLRQNWPSGGTWGTSANEPATRSTREQEWHKEGDDYQITVALTVPIRRPQPGQGLRFGLSVRDRATQSLLAQRDYEWDRLVVEGPAPELHWSNSEDPSSAREVPVGPQVHVEDILDRIRGGNSLAVTAPRRFGKSSLIALLDERVRTWMDAIAIRVDCSAAASGDSSALDHAKLWEIVGEQLIEGTQGVGLDPLTDGQRPPLPTPAAFHKVRAQAARLGKRRIVVFLDEAQRLFEAGPAFGARLRTLIATHLGRTVAELSTIVFGCGSMATSRRSVIPKGCVA